MGRDIVLLFQNPNSTGPTRDAYINEAAHIKTTGDSPHLVFLFHFVKRHVYVCMWMYVRERETTGAKNASPMYIECKCWNNRTRHILNRGRTGQIDGG